jgi:hypothetical protein
MLIYEDTAAVIASRAYELAQTGSFDDYAAIERELFAEGFREDIDRAKKSALQSAITEICDAKRQMPSQRQRREVGGKKVRPEDRLAFATERAYALARLGVFEDFSAIEREIEAEGYAEEAHWLERRGVRDAIDEICIINRQHLKTN